MPNILNNRPNIPPVRSTILNNRATQAIRPCVVCFCYVKICFSVNSDNSDRRKWTVTYILRLIIRYC